MKKQKKWLSWFWLSVVCVVSVAALVFAFIPMHFKNGDYHSFFGAQSYGIDLSDKMVVTYTYKTSSTGSQKDVQSACKKIESILRSKGYVSATVTPQGGDKIEVTLAKPDRGDKLQDAMTLLGSQGIGVGSLELKTENSATAKAVIVGSKHVRSISTVSNSGYYYTVVEFTQEGKNLLSAAEADAESNSKSVSYYLFFGGSSSITGGYAFTPSNNFVNGALYIGGFETAAAAEQYKLLCEAGSLKVDLNAARVSDINYQTNSMATIGRIVLWVFALAVVVAFLVLIGVRHGAYAFVAAFISNAISISVALLLSVAMPWIEVSGASIVVFAICLAVLNINVLSMFERMRSEKLLGKEFDMSVDSGYNKSLFSTIAVGVAMLIGGLICAVAFSGSVQVCATFVAIFGVLNVLSTIGISKGVFNWLVSIAAPNKHTVVWEDK